MVVVTIGTVKSRRLLKILLDSGVRQASIQELAQQILARGKI